METTLQKKPAIIQTRKYTVYVSFPLNPVGRLQCINYWLNTVCPGSSDPT